MLLCVHIKIITIPSVCVGVWVAFLIWQFCQGNINSACSDYSVWFPTVEGFLMLSNMHMVLWVYQPCLRRTGNQFTILISRWINFTFRYTLNLIKYHIRFLFSLHSSFVYLHGINTANWIRSAYIKDVQGVIQFCFLHFNANNIFCVIVQSLGLCQSQT